MPAPTLSPAEIAQLEAEAEKQQGFADSLAAQVPAKTARAAELAVADGGFKKFFDYYNDEIIGQYDAEYRALNGRYIVDPITEADVEGPANIDGSVRTTPTLPDTDVIRVAEFDGDTDYTDEITCPWCGYKQSDSWEAPDRGEEECSNCYNKYAHDRNVTVDYCSTKRCKLKETK